VIHRDIKPENILVSLHGVVKLCDFGFARTLAGPGAKYTDYVATRWYRAPELLVGDTEYGKAVDVWAAGCIFAELLTGQPLFPGDTDIDQLYRIMKSLGQLTQRHTEIFLRNPLFVGVRIPEVGKITPLSSKMPHISHSAMTWLQATLIYDPDHRATTIDMMNHPYFTEDRFPERYEPELHQTIEMEREKEQSERMRRKRAKKFMDNQRSSLNSRKENRDSTYGGDFEDKNNGSIPPISQQKGHYHNIAPLQNSTTGNSYGNLSHTLPPNVNGNSTSQNQKGSKKSHGNATISFPKIGQL
ncbi:Cyclin-dependent kinase-like 3, partial [Kappamyces sp. JEL0680]